MRFFKALLYLFALFLGLSLGLLCNRQYPVESPFAIPKPKTKTDYSPDSSVSVLLLKDPGVKAGKILFKEKCARCHNRNMKQDLIGPSLGDVEERWSQYPEDLYRWIRNSQAMIAEGHPKAKELWKKWQPSIMDSFPELKDEDIAAILKFIEVSYET